MWSGFSVMYISRFVAGCTFFWICQCVNVWSMNERHGALLGYSCKNARERQYSDFSAFIEVRMRKCVNLEVKYCHGHKSLLNTHPFSLY